jgi:GDPmannose 4,6-dehydratase
VTRKITRAVSKIALGLQNQMFMGNLDAKRDWGHAKDYVEGMWRILQQEKPEDFVLATGITTKVRDFIKMAFAEVGIKITFEGKDENEIGRFDGFNSTVFEKVTGLSVEDSELKKGDVLVSIDPEYFRPTEVELLIGDATKAKEKLGWVPKYDLEHLVEDMVASDVLIFKRDLELSKSGYTILNQAE